jgi:uncharacterized protein (DUF362 family)
MKKSTVVIVRKRNSQSLGSIGPESLREMYLQGLSTLAGQRDSKDTVFAYFKDKDRVGIKINTIGGKKISTTPETSLALAKLLTENGLAANNVIIWDRTNRELKEAGYSLNMNQKGIKIFGTDSNSVDYNRNLISFLNIGSLFSSIQADTITASVSLAVLKDHGLAGVTASMKNYFGAIHNPNKYHDNHCDPFVAELFASPQIRNKHRISILDALTVQYHRGPSYHASWAENYGALIFSEDPVAADTAGWQIIEKLRRKKGLPSLIEEQRAPVYLQTAEKMGLGTSNPEHIHISEMEV